MTPPTGTVLHDALIRALQPVTRWRHPYPGDGVPVRVNEHGIDLWENHVGDVRLDPAGPGDIPNAHAYLFLQTGPGGWVATRATGGASITTWRPIVTVAGGTPAKTRWALDKVRPLLDGLILTTPDGATRLTTPLHEGLFPRTDDDPGPLRVDEDPSPPRWYVPIQYVAQAC